MVAETMEFENIFTYDRQPKSFFDWFSVAQNAADCRMSFKQKLFTYRVLPTLSEIITVVIESNTYAQIMPKKTCIEDNNQSCILSQKTESVSPYEKYYSVAETMAKRKLNLTKTSSRDYFLVLYSKNSIDKEISDFAKNLLAISTYLIIVADSNSCISLINEVMRYTNGPNIKRIISCGNPLEWSHNYIGKNTRILFRK